MWIKHNMIHNGICYIAQDMIFLQVYFGSLWFHYAIVLSVATSNRSLLSFSCNYVQLTEKFSWSLFILLLSLIPTRTKYYSISSQVILRLKKQQWKIDNATFLWLTADYDLLQIIDIHQHCLYKTLRTGHTSVSFFLGWKNSPVWLTFTTCTVCMDVGIGYNKFSSSASFISVKIFSYLFLLFQMSYVLLYCETFLLLLSL